MRPWPTRSRLRSHAVLPALCERAALAARRGGGSSRPRSRPPKTGRFSSPAACGFSTRTAPFSTRASEPRSAAAADRATSRSVTARTRRTAFVADTPLTLYQAEWCPLSSAVREVLTELGVDFIARQVEPWPNQRRELRAVADTGEIPVLQTEDGRLYRATREIFAHLRERDAGQFAAAHRRRFADHRDARESDASGQLIEYFRGTGELEAAAGPAEETEVVDVPDASRYELRLGGRLVGLAAYRRRDGRIAFTHTEVDESCEGRGFGGRLAAAALEDARRHGLDVVPLCPFIARYIERHPEYEQVVASGYHEN